MLKLEWKNRKQINGKKIKEKEKEKKNYDIQRWSLLAKSIFQLQLIIGSLSWVISLDGLKLLIKNYDKEEYEYTKNIDYKEVFIILKRF